MECFIIWEVDKRNGTLKAYAYNATGLLTTFEIARSYKELLEVLNPDRKYFIRVLHDQEIIKELT